MVRFLLIVLFVVPVFINTAQASTDWTFEIVHEPRFFTIDQRSMVIDSAGNPHLFYGGNHLYHSYYNGSQWLRETIDPAPRSGRAASVAKDSSGKFHVLYMDAYLPIKNLIPGAGVVKYATNASGQWVIDVLPWVTYCGELSSVEHKGCSIAVDSNGRPHISYSDNGKVMHATKLAAGWQSELVEQDLNFSYQQGYLSLAIDSSNRVHMIYLVYKAGLSYLRYASNVSGVWTSESIDNPVAPGIYYANNSLALDGNGRAHVAYRAAGGFLSYASNTSGAWLTQSLGISGDYPSIALDTSGKAHISYLAYGSNSSVTFSYATNRSGAWLIQPLEAVNTSSGIYSSVAVAASNVVHVAYVNIDLINAKRDLRYFINGASGWSVTSVDASESYSLSPDSNPAGVYSSIARDTLGRFHVSYVQAANDTLRTTGDDDGALMYANNISGNWSIETLAPVYGGVKQTAVAVDTSGKAHIAFFSDHGLFINYITNRNGAWELTKLETTNNLDSIYKGKIGIAIDSSGHVHIAYFANLVGFGASANLRYATNRSGAWQIETVTTIAANVGFSLATDGSAALALDLSGRAHIGYLDGTANVSYATNVLGAWVTKTIALYNRLYAWGAQSMVVEPTGVVHMAFESLVCTGICFSAGIEYASNKSGSWDREFVDDDTYVDITTGVYSEMRSPALTLDSGGKPHISYLYFDFPMGPRIQSLQYAHKLGSLWRISSIEDDLYVGEYNSMTTDANGNVLIAYHDEPNGSLKLAKSTQVPSPLIDVLVSPDNLEFGTVQVSAQASRLITIENLGQLSLSVTNIDLTPGSSAFSLDFSAGSQPCGRGINLTLVPGRRCTFALIFAPSASGQNATTLLIASNDPELPLLVGDFTGNGSTSSSGSSSGSGDGGGGGGGCTIANTSSVDPTLILLLMLSFFYLWGHKARTSPRGS